MYGILSRPYGSPRVAIWRIIELIIVVFCLALSTYRVYAYGAMRQTGYVLLGMGTDVLGLAIVVIFFGALALNPKPKRSDEVFMFLFVLESLVLFCDVASWFMNGYGEMWFFQVFGRYAKNTLIAVMGLVFWIYVKLTLEIPRKASRFGDVAVCLCAFIGLLILYTNEFTGLMFYVDSGGAYHRGTHMFSYYGFIFLMIFIVTGFVHRYSAGMREKVVSFIYLIVNVVMLTIQGMCMGLSLAYLCPLVTLLILYANYHITKNERAIRRESEIRAEKYNVMITQIQPHFLYNVLTSIMAIKGNPPETRDAICDFGKYLRENIASTEWDHSVPFVKELQHVELYLSLEKLRFKEKLDYFFDIQDESFPISPLSLQLIVENAVRHGVTMREEGGSIRISTRRVKGGHLVIVEDDGVGFDKTVLPDDNHPHMGIELCKKRLWEEIRGTLQITSEVGVGTRAEIFVPAFGEGAECAVLEPGLSNNTDKAATR